MSVTDPINASVLLRDLDIVISTLEIGMKARFRETRARRIAHATETYKEVLRLAVLAQFTVAERIDIGKRLTVIRTHLAEISRAVS